MTPANGAHVSAGDFPAAAGGHAGLAMADELTRQADRMLIDFQAALRCRCCPDGLFQRFTGTDEAPGPSPAPRALQRGDFIGLLAEGDRDDAQHDRPEGR